MLETKSQTPDMRYVAQRLQLYAGDSRFNKEVRDLFLEASSFIVKTLTDQDLAGGKTTSEILDEICFRIGELHLELQSTPNDQPAYLLKTEYEGLRDWIRSKRAVLPEAGQIWKIKGYSELYLALRSIPTVPSAGTREYFVGLNGKSYINRGDWKSCIKNENMEFVADSIESLKLG